MKIIFYDFEVFEYDWLVVFEDFNYNITEIRNDPIKLRNFYAEHEDYFFTGFNNKNYDKYIMLGIVDNKDPYLISQDIIVNKIKGWRLVSNNYLQFRQIDLIDELQPISLKAIEGNLGLSIRESKVSFNINRKLTESELEDTSFYCRYDVKKTREVFELRYDDYIKPKALLIKHFNLPVDMISKTRANIAAAILKAKKKSYKDNYEYVIPDSVQVKNQEILKFFKSDLENKFNNKVRLKVTLLGVKCVFGFGGIHGDIKRYKSSNNLVHIDVDSYYPNLQIKFNYLSRNVKNPEDYPKMKKLRDYEKKTNGIMNKPLKVAILSVYGCLRASFNELYDPKQALGICVTGQLLLIDLVEKLEGYINLVQLNTDGIIVESLNDDKVVEIVEEWEQRTQLQMDFTALKTLFQKDVNNYIWIDDNDKIKAIGSWTKYYKSGTFEQNSMTILNEALVNYFVHNIPVEQTINNCKELIKFQLITKKGSSYTHCEVRKNRETQGEKIQNVNRVFAVKDELGQIYKIKEGSPHLIANCPPNALIYNDDLNTCDFDTNRLDKQFYINMANIRIEKFIKEDNNAKLDEPKKFNRVYFKYNYKKGYKILVHTGNNKKIYVDLKTNEIIKTVNFGYGFSGFYKGQQFDEHVEKYLEEMFNKNYKDAEKFKTLLPVIYVKENENEQDNSKFLKNLQVKEFKNITYKVFKNDITNIDRFVTNVKKRGDKIVEKEEYFYITF